MSDYKKTMDRVVMPQGCEERIREMLVLGKKRDLRPVGRRVVRVAAAASAAVLLLMGGTLAVSGGWDDLVDIFRARNEGKYTEKQISQLTELEEVGLSQTSEGITVTVDSVLTTDSSVDVLLKVEAPDARLDSKGNFSFYNFKYDMESEVSRYFGDQTAAAACESVGATGEAVYVVFHYEQLSPSRSLRGGNYVLTLTLEDFYEFGDSRGDEKERYGGTWEFVLPLRELSVEDSIVLENVEIPGWFHEDRTAEKKEISYPVKAVIISAESIRLRYSMSEEDFRRGTIHFDVQAVMKDGKIVDAKQGDGYGVDYNIMAGYFWDETIDLENLDHLLVGGEVVSVLAEE